MSPSSDWLAWVPNQRIPSVFGYADRADDHLRRAAHHIDVLGHECVGRRLGQRHVAERSGVDDAHIGSAGLGAGFEAVHIQLGVTHLDGSDYADLPGLGQGRRHDAHHVATLI